jgi:cell wall-associated NlpC family hydrolase
MTKHWAIDLIGTPWTPDGSGPDSFNCWTLVRWVQQHHFNRILPKIPIAGDDLTNLARAFQNHQERRRWLQVSDPCEGDCVLLRQARYPVHVGIWLETDGGGVLHCVRDAGVVFQKLSDLKRHGWSVEGFYRFQGNTP